MYDAVAEFRTKISFIDRQMEFVVKNYYCVFDSIRAPPFLMKLYKMMEDACESFSINDRLFLLFSFALVECENPDSMDGLYSTARAAGILCEALKNSKRKIDTGMEEMREKRRFTCILFILNGEWAWFLYIIKCTRVLFHLIQIEQRTPKRTHCVRGP